MLRASPSRQVSWRASAALLAAHAAAFGIALLLWDHVYLASRLLFAVLALAWVFPLAVALNRLHISGDALIKVIGWTWLGAEVLLVLLGMIFIAVWDPKETIFLANSRVASYVGCDGATTDPCIIVQQEWRLVPGVAWKRVLYARQGREFTVERVDDEHVLIRANEFIGERRFPAEERLVSTIRWPWQTT